MKNIILRKLFFQILKMFYKFFHILIMILQLSELYQNQDSSMKNIILRKLFFQL